MYSLPFFGIIGGVGLRTVENYITSLNTNLWLDGADPTKIGICQANTTFVCQWTDKSGKGNHATQGNNNSQPNYIDNRVSFTSARFLDITNRAIFASVNSGSNAISGTLFIVGRQPSTTAGGWGRFSTNATSNQTPGSDGNTFAENFLASASSSYTIPNRTPTIPLPWTIINFAHTGTALGLRLNGGTNPQFTNVGLTVPTTTLGQQRIGGQAGDFDIYEILMFPSSIPSDDRLIIEGYLAHKWGLTNLLPLGHRYRDSLQGAFNTSFFSIQTNTPFLPVSLPSLAIAATNATRPEGNTGTTAFTFTVSRSGNTANISSVSWAVTGSGTNQANAADFVGGVFPSGILTFERFVIAAPITINVQGDTIIEGDEQFTVTLSNPVNATITTATAIGVIQNDDEEPPSLAIAATSATKPEGNTGTTAFTFTVSRSGNTANISSVSWAVTGTGTNPANAADFVGEVFPSGTLTLADGITSGVITVNVNGDTLAEQDEQFTVTLSNPVNATITTATAIGLIQNDDTTAPGVVGDVVIADLEGNWIIESDIDTVNNRLYKSGRGVYIFNIDTPSSPSFIASFRPFIGSFSAIARDVKVVGNYAYVAANDFGVQIFNITDPSNPTKVSELVTPEMSYTRAISMNVVGSYAYVGHAPFSSTPSSRVEILNVSDPSSPSFTSSIDTLGRNCYVQVVGDYAYIASGEAGLQIINITNPFSPTLAGSCDTPDYAFHVQVVGNYAYVADGSSGLQIINITNPFSPTLAGSCDIPGSAYGVRVVGDFAYVADLFAALQIIDIRNPVTPALDRTYTIPGSPGKNAYTVRIVGNYAYVGTNTGITIIDLTVNPNP